MSPRFDTKIVVVVRDDLAGWQRSNVVAFLASGIAATEPELLGEPYADAGGTVYAPMFRQPVVVLEGDAEAVRAAHRRAVDRGLRVPVFTAELFATGGDEENRAAVAAVPRDELDLVGVAVHAPRNAADRITKGARTSS
ncbi:DUF2000 domain-containing protein [Actinomycetospora chiangmaiensis]|uniref:DUF2000 domain-containing protein n=1 Tax=Actinomycetospora chiangmaiensis TaxID=402650 RepID=UPI000525A7E2|nr:DUF2000 domain-containing protein [Actinomycetospora chiangmaiensis]